MINELKLKNMYLTHHYIIDWEKVKNHEDIITILKELNLGFDKPSDELQKLCKFVKKESPKESFD